MRNFDVTMRRQNGTLLLASESSFATRDAAGNIERYQGFVLDVTGSAAPKMKCGAATANSMP